MKQYIYALLALLLMLIAGMPASAQFVQKVSKETLVGISNGTKAVTLLSPRRAADKTFVNALSRTCREEWAQTSLQLQMTKSLLQSGGTLAGNHSLNQEGSLPGSSKVATALEQIVQHRENLSKLQKKSDQLLYRWGQLLDENNLLGYTQLASVKSFGTQAATLTLNGQTALIQDTPGFGFTIFPEEIQVNADAINTLIETYANRPETLNQEEPENMAGWFYLRTNFTNSLQEFKAAQTAYATLSNHQGLFANLQNRHSRRTENGIFILRNYNYAAANLALNSAKILQFVSTRPASFPNAIYIYKQIMQLHNIHSGTPTNFQNFWSESLIPLI